MEQVVCIPAGLISDGIHLAGSPEFYEIIRKIERSRFLAVRDKTDKSPMALEHNTSIRQLVTYILVQKDEFLYIYRRTVGTGEKRLAGMYALPGGHMNNLTSSFGEDISQDAMRELMEELVFEPTGYHTVFKTDSSPIPLAVKLCGVFQTSTDADNGVHLVHTGIIVKTNAEAFNVALREHGKMTDLTKVSSDYFQYFEESELWLRLLLPWFPQLASM